MAPKFPNPDPPTDKVRDRLQQFIEVAGRAVYPPLAVAPSPTTPGQVWWDISDTVKIRDEANAAWTDLLTVLGGQPAGGYVRYDQSQSLTAPQQAQVRANSGLGTAGDAGSALGIISTGTVPDGVYVDYRTANGQTWRKIMASSTKSSSSSADITVSFGITFLNIPTPVVSNGDAAAISDIFVSSFANTASGFTATARDKDGALHLSGYRINWEAFGRIE